MHSLLTHMTETEKALEVILDFWEVRESIGPLEDLVLGMRCLYLC